MMPTLDELIQQGKEFVSQFVESPILPGFEEFPIYRVSNDSEYENWKATAKRFIGVNYFNDKAVGEFEQVSNREVSPDNHSKLLAILNAIKTIPQSNTVPMKSGRKGGDIIVNNSNTVNQTQNTTVQYAFFIESIKNELTGRQLQELKDILEQHKDTPETAKSKIIEKLTSFGSNVLASILANVVTNPNIYGMF